MPDDDLTLDEYLAKLDKEPDMTLEKYLLGTNQEVTLEQFQASEEQMTFAEYIQRNFSGEQGPRGEHGATGPQGPQGEPGPAGADGLAGPSGLTGPAGPRGPQGATGERGVDGRQGPRGKQGDQGVQGPSGPVGPRGAKGEKGEQGPRGQAGRDGVDGREGPEGPRGIQGPPGERGSEGIQGPPGKDAPTVPANPAPEVPGLRSLGFSAEEAAPGNHWHHMPESQHARRHGLRLGIDPIFPSEGTANGRVIAFNDGSPDFLEWIEQAGGTGGGAGLSNVTPQTVGTANTPGSGGSASRDDHAHNHGTFSSGGHHPEYSGTAHTHAGGAHDALTLAASADGILDLSAQVLGFDSQSANRVLAAPAGGAGTPSFRLLVAADIPTLPHSGLSGVGANDHHNQAHAIDGADHSGTLAFSALSGTAHAHSAPTVAHGDLTGVASDQHHPQGHALTSGDHTGQLPFGSISGSVTAAQHGIFVSGDLHPEYALDSHAHSHGDLLTVGANDHHNQAHALTSGDHTGQLPFGSLSGSLTGVAQHGTWGDNLHPEYSGTAHTHAGGGTHSFLGESTHPDTKDGSPLDGALVMGSPTSGTPYWSRLPMGTPGTADGFSILARANTPAGALDGRPSWKNLFDQVDPADIGTVPVPGTVLIAAHRGHVHNHGSITTGNPHGQYQPTSGSYASRAVASGSNLGSEYIAIDRRNTRYRVNSSTVWEVVSPQSFIMDWYQDGIQGTYGGFGTIGIQGKIWRMPSDLGSWAPVRSWGHLLQGPTGTPALAQFMYGSDALPGTVLHGTSSDRLTFGTNSGGTTQIEATSSVFTVSGVAADTRVARRWDRVGSGSAGMDFTCAIEWKQIDG